VSEGSHEFSALKSNIFSATVAGQLWAKGLEMGAEMAVEGIRKVGEVIKETVNVAAGERREAMAMTNLLGGRDDAERAIQYMEKFSELSEFGEEKTKSWGMELLNSGYRGQQFKDAMAAIADAASMAPDKMAGAEEAMSSLSRMKLTGKIDARSLKGLRLNVKDVMGDLSDALGMSPEAVKKGLEEGAIPAAKAYDAVLRALERKTGKQLGEAGLAAGRGLDAKLTHWREFPQKIMMAVQNSPGIDKIEHALDRMLEAFDPNGPKGSKMVEGLGSLMDSVGTFIQETNWASVAKDIGGVATSLGAWIDPLAKIAKLTLEVAGAVARLPKLGEALGEGSHGALKKSIEQDPAWGAKAPGLTDLKSALAEDAAANIRDEEMRTAIENTNAEAIRSALGSAAGWGRGSADNAPTKIEAKAEVVVNVNGGTGSPKEVGEAVKAGTQEGMTKALEKSNLQRGTASARRKR
jgi:tape measure domain-containing protein